MKELFKAPVQVFHARTVGPVDMETHTVDVEPVNEVAIPGARLKAAVNSVKDGIVEIPKEGSSVLVGLIGNDSDELYVVKCDEVETVIINGGAYGGLVKVHELKKQLDATKKVLDAIKKSLDDWQPVPNDGGGALKLKLAENLLPYLETGDYSEIENAKVLH